MSSIKQRLLQLVDEKEYSRYSFYKKSGISKNCLSKDGLIREDVLVKAITYFSGVSTDWILFGKGPKMRSNDVLSQVAEADLGKRWSKSDEIKLENQVLRSQLFEAQHKIVRLEDELAIARKALEDASRKKSE